MSETTESAEQAYARRAEIPGTIDFTMMYVAHDAFNRDLGRLCAAADAGKSLSPAALVTWQMFSRQLHFHHTAEDVALWPRLYEVVTEATEKQILEDMETEHGALDPLLQRIDAAIVRGDERTLGESLTALAEGLTVHMRHEEEDALPLIERRLGQAGWDAFGKHVRSEAGLKGGAQYLPWVLDSARPAYATKVLGMLPAPARLLYSRRWEPRYRRTQGLR